MNLSTKVGMSAKDVANLLGFVSMKSPLSTKQNICFFYTGILTNAKIQVQRASLQKVGSVACGGDGWEDWIYPKPRMPVTIRIMFFFLQGILETPTFVTVGKGVDPTLGLDDNERVWP